MTDVAAVAATYASKAIPRAVKTFVVALGAKERRSRARVCVRACRVNTIMAAGGTKTAINVTDPTMRYGDVQTALDGVAEVFGHCGASTACVHGECTAGVSLDA